MTESHRSLPTKQRLLSLPVHSVQSRANSKDEAGYGSKQYYDPVHRDHGG